MKNIDDLRKLLVSSDRAVLTLSSGGCARYAFSIDVVYRTDGRGAPIFAYDSPNPFHHQLLCSSGLHFVIPDERHENGTHKSELVLAGELEEISTAGQAVTYRFVPRSAYHALESGETRELPGFCGLMKAPT